MRETIIILIIIVIIVVGDISIQKYLTKTSEDMSNSLEDVKEKVAEAKKTNDTNDLKQEIKKLEEKWTKTSKLWSIIVVHQEIDNLEQALIRAKSNIEEGELEDAIPEIETAIFYAEHIRDREKVSLKNIF